MKISGIRNEYEKGQTDVKEYRMKLFKKIEELLEYKDLINDSRVSQISVTGDDVVFTIESQNAKGDPYKVDMAIYQDDWGAVPAAMLSTAQGYEPEELRMVNSLFSYIGEEKGVCLDVGANLGWYTLNVCKQYPELTSYAFEPILQTYEKLKRNITLNGLENCRCYNLGLSNENKTITFFYDVEVSGASSMVDLREAGTTEKVDCEIRRLDDFVEKEKIGRIDFIKCDVEGAELFVYQGGLKSIEKYKPIVFSEMLRKWSAKYHYHPNDIIRLFEEIGYQCYVIAENNKLKRFGYVDEETTETNYFFLCPEVHKEIIRDLCIQE